MDNQNSDLSLVLVVDDDPLVRKLIGNKLKNKYAITEAPSGEVALELLTTGLSPSTILLDIKMSEMSGLEVCSSIKGNEETKDIPVIFVSGLDSTEERIAGYDAGGDDYLVKPFDVDELCEKVDVSVSNYGKILALKQNSSFATETAMQAMTSSGEMGVVLEFYRHSFTCMEYGELAQSLCESLTRYGLANVVQIVLPNGETENVDSGGVVKPLEVSLLEKLRDKDRILHFGARTVLNYPHVSVLIKNMPIDDDSKYGRYKDHLALLIEGAGVRVENMIASAMIARQKRALEGLLDNIKTALHEMHETHERSKNSSRETVQALLRHMEGAFLSAGLTEEQEESFITMIERSGDELIELYESGLSIEEPFQAILKEIESIIPKD